MAIRNTAGLDALRALAEGGSAGRSAYQAAQGNEAASRTTALQGALGGSDVAEAAAQAQAKYAPKVDTSGLGVGQLGTAANSYLSQAANKLAAQKYEDTENLSLQAEALRRTQVSDKDRALMMQGAADLMADEQRSKLNPTGLTDLAGQKQSLRQQLTEFDQGQDIIAAGGMIPAEQIMARDEQRGNLLRQMAGVDAEYARQAEQYAGALGTDAAGLMQRYGTEDQAQVADMTNFLAPQQARAERDIVAGGQTRLKELAGAFGIDPLTAAGMFREGASDDKDLSEFNRQQDEASFVEGATDAIDPEEYKVLSKVPGVRNEEIPSILASDNWRGLEELTSDYVASGGKELAGGDGTKLTGIDGYREALLTAAQGATHPDGTPLEAREIQTLVNMMIAKHGTYVNKAFGKGEDSE